MASNLKPVSRLTQGVVLPAPAASLTGQRGFRANRERIRRIRRTFDGWLLPTASIPFGIALRRWARLGAIVRRLQPLTTTLRTREDELSIRVPLLDAWPTYEVFAFNEYAAEPIPWASLRRVIDCGAHVGSFALWLSRWSMAEIVCVEPNPTVLPLLTLNLRPLGARARVFPVAVAGTAGARALHDQGFAAAASLQQRLSHEEGISVAAVTFKALLDQAGFPTIDLLKMDIEGAEFEVFRTMEPETLARISSALIEWHPFAGRPEEIVARLEQSGMTVAHGPQMLIAHRPRGE